MVKHKRILKIFLLVLILTCICNYSFAVADKIIKQGDSFIKTGKNNAGSTMDPAKIQEASKNILGVLFPLAVAVTIIVGAFLGIKIMMSNIEDKSDAKKSLIPYAISCAVVYGALGIWRLTISIMSNF